MKPALLFSEYAVRIEKLASALAGVVFVVALGAQRVHAHDMAVQTLQQTERITGADELAETLTGTVREVIVDDLTRGVSSRYVELALDDGVLVSLRGAAAATLATGARVEMSGRYVGERLDVNSTRTITPAPSAVPTSKANAEIEGMFALLHADDFIGGTSVFVYEVHEATGTVKRLRFASAPMSLAPGMRVRVLGRVGADGASLTPDRITIIARPASTTTGTITKAATANSVLVVMANFSNTVAPSYTAAQAQQVMTTNADSVANFFREASYGQQVMNVTVTPSWVQMNLAQPATCTSSDWQAIGSAADAAARTLGAAYDPSAYNFVVYLFPYVAACGWTGLAYINSPHKAWVNGVGVFRTSTIAHEMGHNFGLLHAASLRCAGAAIGGSCSANEYGDPFDAMGNQRAMHYNVMQKSKLGWIASTSVITHTGASVTYTLTPLEIAGGTTYAVRIPTASTSRTYWLEFRQPIGFDAPLAAFSNNGAQLRVASPFETLCVDCNTWSDDTQFLDMTPASVAFTDGTLASGQTFSDPTYGVSISVLSASANALTVQVATGGAPPTTSFSLIDHYYQTILGRTPDSGGKAYWEGEVVRMENLGVDVKEVYRVMAGNFFNSDEYRSRATSNTQYVTDLYDAFFNRSPDAGGLTYWTGQLAQGLSRDIVLYSFLFSREFDTFMTRLFGDTTSRAEVYAVVDYYRGILGRLPDTGGFSYWVDQFHAAQCSGANAASAIYAAADAISRQFVASGEYASRQRNNAQYVADLYYAFLRRGGDIGGVAYWVDRLNTGVEDGETMRKEFIASPEFSGRVNAIIAQGC